jgi:hypothetical protein
MPKVPRCRAARSSSNRPISVYRLAEMPIQSCGQSVSAPRVKAGARLNAHTELRANRQRSAREVIYQNRPVPVLAQIHRESLSSRVSSEIERETLSVHTRSRVGSEMERNAIGLYQVPRQLRDGGRSFRFIRFIRRHEACARTLSKQSG